MTDRTTPRALSFWTVDEIIECLDVDGIVESELMLHAPDAYCGDGILVDEIWSMLSVESREAIISAERKQAQELGY